MSLVRTWSGSVIHLNPDNFFKWLQGWVRWTLRLRPAAPCHNHQPQHRDFPPAVRPWRDPQQISQEG